MASNWNARPRSVQYIGRASKILRKSHPENSLQSQEIGGRHHMHQVSGSFINYLRILTEFRTENQSKNLVALKRTSYNIPMLYQDFSIFEFLKVFFSDAQCSRLNQIMTTDCLEIYINCTYFVQRFATYPGFSEKDFGL